MEKVWKRIKHTIAVVEATEIEEARKSSGVKELIYVDVHGKLCCTKTLESAIQIVKYNESI